MTAISGHGARSGWQWAGRGQANGLVTERNTLITVSDEGILSSPRLLHHRKARKREKTLAEATQLVKVADTVTIVPQNLDIQVPAVPAHLLIAEICRIYTTYARFDRIEDVITLALWTASTWFVEPTAAQGMTNGTLLFEAHPRILLIGEPESGKNRVMKIMRRLVRNPSGIGTAKVTAVGVRNLLNHGETVFIDEYHKRVGTTGRRNYDLQEDILAYSQDSVSIDGAYGQDNQRNLFGPIVLAAQPEILTGMQGDALNDLFQRCFLITLHPAADRIPALDGMFETDCEDIRVALEMWAAGLYETEMRGRKSKRYTAIHSMPDSFTGRRLECADVLCAVADRAVNPKMLTAGQQDTQWARYARDAAQLLLDGRGDVAEIAGRIAARFDDQGLTLSVDDALSAVRDTFRGVSLPVTE